MTPELFSLFLQFVLIGYFGSLSLVVIGICIYFLFRAFLTSKNV